MPQHQCPKCDSRITPKGSWGSPRPSTFGWACRRPSTLPAGNESPNTPTPSHTPWHAPPKHSRTCKPLRQTEKSAQRRFANWPESTVTLKPSSRCWNINLTDASLLALKGGWNKSEFPVTIQPGPFWKRIPAWTGSPQPKAISGPWQTACGRDPRQRR